MSPRLILVVGLPGTGKTTLSRAIAEDLSATYLRIDAIETAIQVARSDGSQVGPEGYFVAHFLARANLELGRDVVVDAVCPVPESRTGWSETARGCGAKLIIFETSLPDLAEHRRRVQERRPDMAGQQVPTWESVEALDWAPWDDERDGSRTVVDTTSRTAARARAHAVLRTHDHETDVANRSHAR